jgi:hypothetical protein
MLIKCSPGNIIGMDIRIYKDIYENRPCSVTRKNLTTCQQDVFATGLQQACQQVVTMLLFYQVATRLSLTTC